MAEEVRGRELGECGSALNVCGEGALVSGDCFSDAVSGWYERPLLGAEVAFQPFPQAVQSCRSVSQVNWRVRA